MKDVSNFMLHPMLWPARPADPAVCPIFRGNSNNSKILKNFDFFTETPPEPTLHVFNLLAVGTFFLRSHLHEAMRFHLIDRRFI